MRHIQIKILTVIAMILLSVSSYGQMQQVLRNGFVAATDSGVWYLQDGFSEWVRLGNIKADVYDDRFVRDVDTISAVSYYNSKIDVLGYGVDILTNDGVTYNNADFTAALYGNRLFSLRHGNYARGGNELKTKSLNNKLKYTLGKLQLTDYVNSINVQVWTSWYNSSGYFGIFFTNNIQNSNFSTDNDSTCVVVCGDNKAYRLIIEEGSESDVSRTTYNEIMGLHSRPIDSHQICYNPDDDEFIIVSDSGIVYSYDKTTVTTLDTIKTSILPTGSTITDLEWWGGSAIFIGYKNDTGNGVSFYSLGQQMQFYTSSSTSDVFISKSNLKYIQANNNIFMAILSYDNVKIFTPSIINGEINKNTDNLPTGITVFDLDYINYIPD